MISVLTPTFRPSYSAETRVINKPRLLVLSHVLPFPRSAGQQQRVFYTLQAAREAFHVTFATSVADRDRERVKKELLKVCDDTILLPSKYLRSKVGRALHRAIGALYAFKTGLKFSNYVIGQLEFSPSRMTSHLASSRFDCVLFEYWHAANSVEVFRNEGIPCVLDMHDILWQAYARELDAQSIVPAAWKRRKISKYRAQEEAAWQQFDGLVAINHEEMKYTVPKVSGETKVFHAPMGTDLALWPYSWRPVQPLRVAYYGSLKSPHNQQDALKCFTNIMPKVWSRFPDAELWLVGSNPPEFISALTADTRVKVTGYVEDVQPILQTMSVVVCPWSGTYGFRSRLIEVMALGVPLVASRDAIWGMQLENSSVLLIGEDEDTLAEQALKLLEDSSFALEQSLRARTEIERIFSLDRTYGKLVHDLSSWLQARRGIAE